MALRLEKPLPFLAFGKGSKFEFRGYPFGMLRAILEFYSFKETIALEG